MAEFREGQVVLVDTNVIIEAHRTGCWKAFAGWFRVETVGKCVEEAGTGGAHAPGYVTVDVSALREAVTIHPDDRTCVLAAMFQWPSLRKLDPGGRELLAFAAEYNADWVAASPDKACLRTAHEMELLDRFVSVERIARSAGADVDALRTQYTEKWHEAFRVDLLLGL